MTASTINIREQNKITPPPHRLDRLPSSPIGRRRCQRHSTHKPPTKVGTATTSKESSQPILNFSPMASAQTAQAMTPMTMAPIGSTNPQARIITTKPQRQHRIRRRGTSRGRRGAFRQAASRGALRSWPGGDAVFQTSAGIPSTTRFRWDIESEPTDHSRPDQSVTKGRVCGSMMSTCMNASRLQSTTCRRRPGSVPHSWGRTRATGEDRGTEMLLPMIPVDPGKDSNPRPHRAIGDVDDGQPQKPANSSNQPNLTRSAPAAPLISATVMMANIAWNPMKTISGGPEAFQPMTLAGPLSPKFAKGSPMKPARVSGPNPIPSPHRAQTTKTTPMAPNSSWGC